MVQYAMYLRKSRSDLDVEQQERIDVLQRHEKLLFELACKSKLNIVKVFKEVVSGDSISARPQMQALLSEVEQGIYEGVLVVDVDRLARGDTVDQGIMAQTFKYSDTKIITPMKTYDPNNEFDEEYFEFGLFMSRREYKTINRRLQRGRLASVKEGKFVGNIAPYGYVRKRLEHDKGFTLEPDPEESEVVKLIYELYTRGNKLPDGSYKRLGVALITRKLNNLKIKPRKSDVWVTSSVRDILINPVYNGKIRWNWRPANKKMENGEMRVERPRAASGDWTLVKGLHEALVDDETWNLVQEFMKLNPPHPAPSQYPLMNPLSGIVICGKCGRRMVRRPYKNGKPATLMCPVTSCDNVSSQLGIVEKHILEALKIWLHEYTIKLGTETEKNPRDVQMDIQKRALKKLNEEIKTLEKQMENSHDLLEQGVYSTEMFLDRSKRLSEKMKTAQRDKKQIETELDMETRQEDSRTRVIPKMEEVLGEYTSTDDPKRKNELLKGILDKIFYTKTVNARWNNSKDDFLIELKPKLPRAGK